jgi:hypothetical protein
VTDKKRKAKLTDGHEKMEELLQYAEFVCTCITQSAPMMQMNEDITEFYFKWLLAAEQRMEEESLK